MKVLCIENPVPNKPIPHPIEGGVYTVIQSLKADDGVLIYILQEFDSNWAWAAKIFIPLSNIDKTELIKERELLTEKI